MDVNASCGVCERDLEFGYLCPGDILALAERLEQLPGLASALSGALAPAARPVTERVSTSGYGPSTPVNDSALELWYGGMATVLERWRSDIQSWKGWGEPVVEGNVDRRVHAACRWIAMNLEWIAAEYPSAGDLGKETGELEGAALSILGDGREREARGKLLGRCVNADAQGVACGAPIRHREGETAIVCEWCHCVYRDEQDWLLLLHHQPKEAASTPGGAGAPGGHPSRA